MALSHRRQRGPISKTTTARFTHGDGLPSGMRFWQRPLDTLGVLLALAYAVPALFYPHGNDQALHAYIGQGILLGELPYQSGISGKPPLIFVAHAIATLLFGANQWAIRALEALCLWPMAVWVAMLFRANGPRRDGDVGAAAVLLSGFNYTYFDYWDLSHPELGVALCTLWSLRIATLSTRPHVRPWLCGVAGGAAFMFKYTAAALALPVAMYCGYRALREAHAAERSMLISLLRAAGLYLLGVALVIAACIAPFVIFSAFEPMWEIMYTFTVRYVKQAPGVGITMQWTREDVGGWALRVSLAMLAFGLLTAAIRRKWSDLGQGLALMGVLAGGLLTVWMQKRFFSYHFTVAAPFLAASIFYGMKMALPRASTVTLFASIALVAVALYEQPLFCTNRKYNYLAHIKNLDAYGRGEISRWQYLKPFTGMNYLDHYRIHERIGLEAKKRSKPGDQLCARGFATAIYQVSGMRCPSRHVMQSWPAGLPSWEGEWKRDIRQHHPRFIVTFRDRPREVRWLERLGYRKTRMPSIYLLMDREATPPGSAENRRPRPRNVRHRAAQR